jgi:hypothetical protein
VFLPLTENYIANKFFQNCGKPYYNRIQKTYQGSCPICREGKSWLKKRRCYYIVEKNVVCCHNCGWYGSPYNWILKVTGLSFQDIKKELENFDTVVLENSSIEKIVKSITVEDLPVDSINLTDEDQLSYYKENKIVQDTLKLLKYRKLDTAVNRPKNFYISLVDKVHDNRLILPFYDSGGRIIFYQTRSVLPDDSRPKYLSKVGSEKSLYGINSVSSDLDFLFITEGPIDAMFIKNGIAVAGINESKTKNYTNTQAQQIAEFILYKKIWVLDNQFNDKTSRLKTRSLIESGETVFLWPEKFKQYKDINEYCIDKNVSEFDANTIIDNSYSGLKAKILLSNY